MDLLQVDVSSIKSCFPSRIEDIKYSRNTFASIRLAASTPQLDQFIMVHLFVYPKFHWLRQLVIFGRELNRDQKGAMANTK